MPFRILFAFIVLSFFGGVTSGVLFGDDWRSIRGNDGLGIWKTRTALSGSGKVGLKIRWKKKLGSGYSSVVISKGRAITMFTDGEHDQVICLDTKDGEKIWSQKLEEMFKGSNGSFDGPIATPVIHGNQVFCLTARGKLFSFDLDSGKQNWVRDLVKEEAANRPMYGFSTTPLVAGDTLCVLAGTRTGALLGLDLKNGATKWKVGKGQVSSQIPALLDIGGKPVVVSGAGRSVIGVDPQNGKQLFEFEHNGSNGSAMMPVPLGDNRILLTNDDSFSRVFQINPAESGYDVTEAWSDRSIKNTYNVPLAVKENVFAYSTRILTCVDALTGKPKWKSRKPGDGFMIAVDGHLVIVTKKGTVHVARQNDKKYEELASAKVFENLVWSVPAYADNAIYVRSLAEVACVEIVGESSALATNPNGTLPIGKSFQTLLERVKTAASGNEKQEIVDRFVKEQSIFPYVEDGVAHFLYQGAAKDLALACDVFGSRQEEKMLSVPGTNLFYYSMKLPADQRISYVFLKDFKPIADPLNSRKMTSSMYAGEMEFAIRLRNEKPLEMSWFGMQDWKSPSWMHLHRKTRLAGKVVEDQVKGKDDSNFLMDVYLPPGYEKQEEKRYPVIYVHGGSVALSLGELDEVADLFFQSQPERSSILVFLKSAPTSGLNSYLESIAKKVVPYVDGKYRTIGKRTQRASLGAGFACSTAMALAAQHPDVFGACSVQSPLVFDQARQMLITSFQKVELPCRIYIEWGRFDMYNPVENWDIREMAQTMKREISKNQNVKMLGGQVNDSTDWGSWKNRFDVIVGALFGE